MPGKLNYTLLDYSEEKSSVGCYLPNFTAANFDAQNTLVDNLITAILGVAGGTPIKDERVATVTRFAPIPPADETEQREQKWLVSCTDNVTGFEVTFEIPIATPTGLLLPNTDRMDLESTQGAALKAAVDAVVRSRAGNPVTMLRATYVGRNL